jgi:hypothetical protein
MKVLASFSSQRSGVKSTRLAIARMACLIVAAGFLLHAAPAAARIIKTRRNLTQLNLTLGSGLEFETDSEQTEYDSPFLVEYALTETVTLSFEPNYIVIHSKTDEPSVSGWGDLETTVTWEATDEYHWRPAFALEGTVKWQTATDDQLGTGANDYVFGVILSKTHRSISVDADLVYKWLGEPGGSGGSSAYEASLAFEWALSFVFDLEGEILTSTGGSTGRPGTISGVGAGTEPIGTQSEVTLGVAEHFFERLKLEQGGIFQSDGSWQLVFAWEWEFGSGR